MCNLFLPRSRQFAEKKCKTSNAIPVKPAFKDFRKKYMSSRIALSVTVTDLSVLSTDLIREGGQSGRSFGDYNDSGRNQDIFEL